MAYGVYLGILLMCLVQAEHVCCSWAAQAQRLNSNTYVGFSHQDGGFGGSYPQNELRQASVSPRSAQSGSFNTETAVSGGYSRGLSSSGYTQHVSQLDKSVYASVGSVQSSSVSKPTNWRKVTLVNAQKMPKKQLFGLSTSIASGSSVSKYNEKRIQQGEPSTSKYLSSSSASLQSPSRESYSFNSASHQSAAQKAPTPSTSSSLFGAGAPPPPHGRPVQTRTSSSALARRVSSRCSSVASKPSTFSSLQNEWIGNDPSQTEAGKPYTSKLFPVNAGNAQGSYKPTSTSHMTSSRYGQSVPVSDKPSAPAGFQPSRLQTSTSYTSVEQIPSSTGTGTSGQRFAPTRTHNIPQRHGGHPIRRLKEPDQREGSVSKPQQAYVAPLQPYVAPQRPATQQAYVAPKQLAASYKPQAQRVHQETKWKRIRLRPAQ
ncbi:probable serine/threonine-protein kinase nek3 [Sebastes umbrosus]|uniref:probable serine/threonine-protein kinase nek3 n=1 Tax=Sebastes umbrosus TaxID=72105 RepID=UPI0018A0EBA0|nr:probable serine/threonine-protein kinase nek3 [Sebastes umbrosus]